MIDYSVSFQKDRLHADLNELLRSPDAQECLARYAQISFRNRTENEAKGFHDGVLRIYDYPDNDEHDFKYWYSGTPSYFLECLKQIETMLAPKYSVGRVRLMLQRPKTNLGLHIDENNTFRLHVPVQTNGSAIFVSGTRKDDLSILTMPEEGKLYLLDTTVYHSSLNLDESQDRYHLLINVLDAKQSD